MKNVLATFLQNEEFLSWIRNNAQKFYKFDSMKEDPENPYVISKRKKSGPLTPKHQKMFDEFKEVLDTEDREKIIECINSSIKSLGTEEEDLDFIQEIINFLNKKRKQEWGIL